MKTFQYNIMKVKDAQGNYIEFPSIAQKDPITLKANLTTTESGYALDANQGYALDLKKVNKTGDIMTGQLAVEMSRPIIGVRSTTCEIEGGIGVEPSTGCFGVVSQSQDGEKQVSLLFNPNFTSTSADDALQLSVIGSDEDTYTVLHTGNMWMYSWTYMSIYSKDISITATSGGWGNAANTPTSIYYGGYMPVATVYDDGTCRLNYTEACQVVASNTVKYKDSSGTEKTATGSFGITLGNDINYTLANGYRGFLWLYSHLTYYSCLYSIENKSNRYIYLPTDSASSNSLYLTATPSSSNAGSATRPVYISGSVVKECNLSVVCQASQPTSPHTGMIWLKPVS